MKSTARSIVVAMLAVVAPHFASAQSVVFDDPTHDSSNCIPFACSYTNGRYQQVYLGSVFGSTPVSISSATFFRDENYPASTFLSANYTVSMSTTARQPNALSSMFANNVGPDVTTVFTGNLSGPIGSSFTLAFTSPFLFNPQAGNLLFDMLVTGGNGTLSGFLDAFNPSTISSRLSSNNGTETGNPDGLALHTEFATSDTTVTPEPSALLLLGSGIAGLAGLARRRNSRRA